ncbi:hypothetical protein [Cupriavidus taiwanensis]|uniref:hypothetical protein n=1 Tax=Cupriavidus taiwanensis TaxID=164546 RepID=UPI00047214C0|nr:hypothetical protein [Cupriavidus taiwanensis]SOZ08456.1 conserved exported protein of unknown function [Cupriavidus taiwanensis]SOZ13247.1 conserved exported protein of unknown function [Cupriavidus taiwanensis]
MKIKPTALAGVLAAGALALAPTSGTACGSDFVLGDEVGAAHPASIGVAFAMNDALSGGALPPSENLAGKEARLRADDAAHMLEQRLAPVRSKLPPTSLLLVETRLWTRYVPVAQRKADVHADHDAGPAEGDVVVVTGEQVLRGLLEGRISWQQAVDSGLVVVTGDSLNRTRVASLLAGRFAQPSGAALASHDQPVRR